MGNSSREIFMSEAFSAGLGMALGLVARAHKEATTLGNPVKFFVVVS